MDSTQFREAAVAATDESTYLPLPQHNIISDSHLSRTILRNPPHAPRSLKRLTRLPPKTPPPLSTPHTRTMERDPSRHRNQNNARSNPLAIPKLHGLLPRLLFLPRHAGRTLFRRLHRSSF